MLGFWFHPSVLGSFVSLSCLLLVLDDVLLLKLAHPLDLIKVDNKTLVFGMKLLDALSAEHCHMVRAVEMLYAVLVLLTQLAPQAFLVVFVEVKTSLRKHLVFFHNLVENVDVQW